MFNAYLSGSTMAVRYDTTISNIIYQCYTKRLLISCQLKRDLIVIQLYIHVVKCTSVKSLAHQISYFIYCTKPRIIMINKN